MNFGVYSVSGVKTFMGMEGHGFNAHLLENGKKVAFVMDDANGGCYNWQWKDKDAAARFKAHLDSIPKKSDFEFQDSFIGALIDDFEWNRKIRRMCKTKTLVTVKGDKEGEVRTFKLAYLPERKEKLAAYCDKNYGAGNWTCLNEQLKVW